MPPRSAIVCFSVEEVYATAELIRRQKGGCAVVMGALSPRTRNAQVAMYQAGEVDYLVATDAIGMPDHGAIVWDEVIGFGVTMIAAPAGWEWVLAGFVLFRLFDVLKPWPISWFDRRIHGGLGIMLDDLIAGLFALLCMQLLARW